MKFFNRDGKLVDPPTRRLKFTDNSGYIKDRLVEIPHSSCPTHDAAHDAARPALHLWLHPTVDANAGAWGEQKAGYASGENPRVPMQRGARQDQREPTGFAGPATENEMPLASYEQGSEPRRLYDRRDQTGPSPASTPSPPSGMAAPLDEGGPAPRGTKLDQFGNASGGDRRYIDARTVKISGTDQHGRMWSATTWGPYSERGEGASVDPVDPPEMRRMGDRMLTSLEHNSGNMVAGLASYQRLLNRAYRR
jgi:hypothetical protein